MLLSSLIFAAQLKRIYRVLMSVLQLVFATNRLSVFRRWKGVVGTVGKSSQNTPVVSESGSLIVLSGEGCSGLPAAVAPYQRR